MKLLTIVAALALTTSSAMALESSLAIKGRFDYVNTKTDNNPGKTSSGVLTTSFLRLGADAKLNDVTSVKLVLDFQPAAKVDNGINSLVDEAVLTRNFGHGITVAFGKQAVLTGGRENDYSTRDLYLTSTYKGQIGDNITGATAGYEIAGQNIYLQYLQQTDTIKSNLTDKKVVGAAYYGDIMSKMIVPIISYHQMGTARVGAKDVYTTIGLRFNVAKVIVEADYLTLKQEKLSVARGDAKLDSVVAHVRYVYENFQPFAKFITEKGKKGFDKIVTGATDSKRTAWEVGMEYVPTKDEDMRYHVVYNSAESKRENAPTSKVEEKKLYAGIAFGYNILK